MQLHPPQITNTPSHTINHRCLQSYNLVIHILQYYLVARLPLLLLLTLSFIILNAHALNFYLVFKGGEIVGGGGGQRGWEEEIEGIACVGGV